MSQLGGMLADAGSVLTHAADALSVVSSTVVVAALFLAWNRSARRSLTSLRRQVLSALGLTNSLSSAFRALPVKQRVGELRRGRDHSAGGELEWLARVAGHSPDAPLVQLIAADGLRAAAKCYETYAARLDSRVLLGSASLPILERDKQVALATAERLREALDAETPDPNLVGRSEHFMGPDGAVLTWHSRVRPELRLVGFDLLVSHRRHRIVPDAPEAIARAVEDRATFELLDTDEGERRRLREYFSGQWFRFDAALPRITSWAVQRDRSNGRPRLHLRVAECTFSSVLLDHYPPRDSEDDARPGRIGRVGRLADGDTGLLTLALMIVTSDNDLVFVNRSRHVAVGMELFGPTVSGNMELNPRRRLVADFDASGFPDPLGVAVRETREELGLQLDREDVACVGLGEINDAHERGTHVLLLTARVPESSAELVAAATLCDLSPEPVEIGAGTDGLPPDIREFRR